MNRRAFLFFALAVATYVHDVKPILDRHCVECHTIGSDLNLTQFPFLGTGEQPNIVDRMIAKVSASPPSMPPGHRPKLSAAEIDVLRAWRSGGLKP